MSDAHEPWAPTVGCRVRVRVNPECPFASRGARFNGHIGTVEQIVDWYTDGHCYYVRFDDPEVDRLQRIGVRIAADELEPVDG